MTFAVWQRVTWHNAMEGLPVWAKWEGAWRTATMYKLGPRRVEVRFEGDLTHYAYRPYHELAYRKIKNNGSDKPKEGV